MKAGRTKAGESGGHGVCPSCAWLFCVRERQRPSAAEHQGGHAVSEREGERHRVLKSCFGLSHSPRIGVVKWGALKRQGGGGSHSLAIPSG